MKNTIAFVKENLARIPRFFQQWRRYGFSVAFWTFLHPFHRIFGFLRPYVPMRKHLAILTYLYDRYEHVINRFAHNSPAKETLIPSDFTIWVCWWDGEAAMPVLVKTCYNTIRASADGHPVKLVTKDNFRDFVHIPEYILEKVNSKVMTVTHFSNILRVALLYEYGGIWLDATILMLQNISQIKLQTMPFYTLKAPAPKNAGVTIVKFAELADKSARRRNLKAPEISRWSGFLLAGTKHSFAFEYLREILYAYWKDHDHQIEYWLYDYTIALGYDNIPAFKKLIDDVPCSAARKFVLEENLNRKYSPEKLAEYSLTPFHKLTWKKHFNTHTKDGHLTMYGHIVNRATLKTPIGDF